VTRWGESFGTVEDISLGGAPASGYIILARRPINSTTWTIRLVGEDSNVGWSLGSRTRNAGADGYYEVQENGTVYVINSNGTKSLLDLMPEAAP
jgi:hypothetical protein